MSQSTSTQRITLDEILEQAAEQWRAWREDHPDHRRLTGLTRQEAEDMDEDDGHERSRIAGELADDLDKPTLLALAADPRVWGVHVGSLNDARIEEAIRQAIRQLTYAVADAADMAEDEAR